MRRFALIIFFAALAFAAIGPIRNYDFFWHLATGRWIVEHGALPAADPFAVASDRVPWINGEWLFELALQPVSGIENFSFVRAVFIALLFLLAYRFSEGERDGALLLTALAFAGGMATLDLRPSSVAALFVVLAIAIARRGNDWLYALLTVVWINTHPSALLAPLIAILITRRAFMPFVAAIALLINPYSYHGVLAPLRLMTFVSGGTFVNAEWLPSLPVTFPLLYVTIAIWTAAALAAAFRRRGTAAASQSGGLAAAVHIALGVVLAYLAVRHVRNQPLWFAAFPLLVAPAFPRVHRGLAYAACAALIAAVAIREDHRLGIAPERFPVSAVARLKAANLEGNIYNPDQFGGFLIWSFYPERRALTDGRNELYHSYIPEYARARKDSRAWTALLRKYRIDLAVDEHRAPLDVIDARTGGSRQMDASLAYWPRKDWALIAHDEAAMVFARRAAFPRDVIAKWELRD
ncbi:MAG TPA: hypothetical protein VNA69_13670 [Thermoanaerobaculia bacterium]|nr:hypothetical protein [Thermoanaerobaculia bacterium]